MSKTFNTVCGALVGGTLGFFAGEALAESNTFMEKSPAIEGQPLAQPEVVIDIPLTSKAFVFGGFEQETADKLFILVFTAGGAALGALGGAVSRRGSSGESGWGAWLGVDSLLDGDTSDGGGGDD